MLNRFLRSDGLRDLLGDWRVCIFLLAPAAALFRRFDFHPVLAFGAAALAIVPVASLLGDGSEELAAHVGPAAAGLINATLGNITELIVAIVALWAGHTEVVKASITGSIISNLLLVFGMAAFAGGLGREILTFNRVAVGASTSMLFLAVVALVMPAIFQLTVVGALKPTGALIERVSLLTAAVLLASYLASLIFVFRTHRNLLRGERIDSPRLRKRTAVLLLGAGTALALWMSEILVSQIGQVTRALGWTELFLGLVILGVIANAAEHSSAVMVARRGKMELALNIAVGSSTQIALFVAPLLVFVSKALPAPMSLVFHPLEIAALIFSVGLVTVVSADGETNWFEGLQLVGLYVVLGIFFYYLPASPG